ncbi:GNAT family N-acetyltransferase [Henriciella litoralis]|uniref:GNAT family N-acetyltransferase n=1 Tax=Henriciella litoralis TaxID=568102 RepID=UPI000A0359D7|nr:GNAT family N-acetyltransferase [Henriciella litoralis]
MSSIRPLKPDDIPAIAQLIARAGFPKRSHDGLHWAFFGNPQQGDIPAGLLKEKEGKPVAMIGLQARDFKIDGQLEKAVVGHTFISSPEGRGAGFILARKALKTPGIAAIYSLNNNALAGRFHKKIGLTAWLGEAGRKRMEWPIRPITMAKGLALSGLARKEKLYDRLSKREFFKVRFDRLDHYSLSQPLTQFLAPETPHHAALINEFGRHVGDGTTVSPVRTGEVYAYQMADPDAPGRIALIGLNEGRSLSAIMQVALTKPNSFEPAELEVIDLETVPGCDPARLIQTLIREAQSIARQAGLSRVRLPLATRFPDKVFSHTGLKLSRRFSYDPAHAWFADETGEMAKNWTPTGFEGDFFFALRLSEPMPDNEPQASARLETVSDG